ncbi:hypothetical protein BVC80_1211g42 [Macleaya cordata]|uniref:Uncharacterized protein n=1 Tax=Macleaya cordata TaxID=56857 RepID=A0A200Q3E0_MACCD|nr:hypothetical protein BVC80_1211g42 [Macleaya cordata]
MDFRFEDKWSSPTYFEELEQAFPDEIEAYREMRATSAAESKRLGQTESILPNGDVKVKNDH